MGEKTLASGSNLFQIFWEICSIVPPWQSTPDSSMVQLGNRLSVARLFLLLSDLVQVTHCVSRVWMKNVNGRSDPDFQRHFHLTIRMTEEAGAGTFLLCA